MHRVDKYPRMFRIDMGVNTMAEIKHMAGACTEAFQDGRDFITDAFG